MRGERDVTVLDKGPLFVTGGSSSHAPGLISRTSPSRFMQATADYTIEKYAGLSTDEGPALVPVGTLEVAYTDDRLRELWRRHDVARSWGWRGRMLEPDQARERWPILRAEGLLGAYATDGEGLAAARRAVQAQAERAQAGGVTFRGGVNVTGFATGDGHLTGVVTDDGTVPADVAIVCAGVWGPLLARTVGLTLPMLAMEHQYAITTPIEELAANADGVGDDADPAPPRRRHLLPRPRRPRRDRVVPPPRAAGPARGPRHASPQRRGPRLRLHGRGLVGRLEGVRGPAARPRRGGAHRAVQRRVRVHARRLPADGGAPRARGPLVRRVGLGDALRRRGAGPGRADRRRRRVDRRLARGPDAIRRARADAGRVRSPVRRPVPRRLRGAPPGGTAHVGARAALVAVRRRAARARRRVLRRRHLGASAVVRGERRPAGRRSRARPRRVVVRALVAGRDRRASGRARARRRVRYDTAPPDRGDRRRRRALPAAHGRGAVRRPRGLGALLGPARRAGRHPLGRDGRPLRGGPVRDRGERAAGPGVAPRPRGPRRRRRDRSRHGPAGVPRGLGAAGSRRAPAGDRRRPVGRGVPVPVGSPDPDRRDPGRGRPDLLRRRAGLGADVVGRGRPGTLGRRLARGVGRGHGRGRPGGPRIAQDREGLPRVGGRHHPRVRPRGIGTRRSPSGATTATSSVATACRRDRLPTVASDASCSRGRSR